MRSETNPAKIISFMKALATKVGEGRIYFTGGASALLHGWRATTIDVDIKAEPEPAHLFESLAVLKDDLDINIELASPDQFIPPLPSWQERSEFIARHGRVDFYHYDFYSQALAKIERGHDRDLRDVRAMLEKSLIQIPRLSEYFEAIIPQMPRYPAINPTFFRRAFVEFCASVKDHE